MIPQLLFVHRDNHDSTRDSICMNCFLTVAHGTEEDLIEAERNHDCERSIHAEYAQSEHFQYGPV
jgi:hypothetical protein